MIDGLKIQMSSEELATRLSERASSNEMKADERERELRTPRATREDPCATDDVLEYESEMYRARAVTLRLLRDHLVPGEIYLLCENDLQFADLVPELNVDMRPAPFTYDGSDVR